MKGNEFYIYINDPYSQYYQNYINTGGKAVLGLPQ